MKNWVVHKFGGSSLGSAELFRRVADIVAARHVDNSLVVVSAMGDTTDLLVNTIETAAAGNDVSEQLAHCRESIASIATELLGPIAMDRFENDLTMIADICTTLQLLKNLPQSAYDYVVGFGELWSARLLSEYLCSRGLSAESLDAREVIRVESIASRSSTSDQDQTASAAVHGSRSVTVDWNGSSERLVKWQQSCQSPIVIATGFTASNQAGVPVTLGRNGSDYSAAIFGRLLNANSVNIWTDVPGVMNADPRWVTDARPISTLSYDEALELAFFGAHVLHPKTIAPLREAQIPLYITNTFDPSADGTQIHSGSTHHREIKGVTAITSMALVTISGSGLSGVVGTSQRVFSALKDARVSVVLIAQASSEHAICVTVDSEDGKAAQQALSIEFDREIRMGRVDRILLLDDCSIIAAVGDAMSGHPGVAARFFRSLAHANINVRAIAQDASERNISAVIRAEHTRKAVQAVHAGFYLSPRTLSIGVIGPGNVGAVMLEQLSDQLEQLREKSGLDLRVVALANSRQMLLSDSPLSLADWRSALAQESGAPSLQATDLDAFSSHVKQPHLPHAVIIDCTASDPVADLHLQWLEQGLHVITPNKKANAGDLELYRAMHQAAQRNKVHYLYETTVGAGLPVIGTLRDLILTGDRIHSISGIFSGTLSYLFNCYDGSQPFSDLVRQARDAGYTEPDPRDDLSGMDVVRKLLILAREAGFDLTLDEIEVNSLVPDSMNDCSVDEFLLRLGEEDDAMLARLQKASDDGQVLRYVASFTEDGVASVGLVALSSDHAFAHINLTDNVIEFVTDRYSDNPLVIQGPGAGPEVTAAGLFADLLRLCSMLGDDPWQ